MVEQRLIPGEGGFRNEEVDGAIVIGMELAVTEEGVLRAILTVDDNKGLISYRMGNVADFAAQLTSPEFTIPGFGMSTDFNKIIKSLMALGYESYWDVEAKTWRTNPPLVGKKITIRKVKTGSGKNKQDQPVDYYSLIDVVDIGGAGVPLSPEPANTTQLSGHTTSTKGALIPEILSAWREIIDKILSKPMTVIEINSAIIKTIPDEPSGKNKALRTSLAEVRAAALSALVAEGSIQVSMDTPPKYSPIPV
jgi:hypothetical protein